METFSAVQALCEANLPVTGGYPSQKPGARSFEAFFDLHLSKRLGKQSIRRWFETASRSLWIHCNELWFSLSLLVNSKYNGQMNTFQYPLSDPVTL